MERTSNNLAMSRSSWTDNMWKRTIFSNTPCQLSKIRERILLMGLRSGGGLGTSAGNISSRVSVSVKSDESGTTREDKLLLSGCWYLNWLDHVSKFCVFVVPTIMHSPNCTFAIETDELSQFIQSSDQAGLHKRVHLCFFIYPAKVSVRFNRMHCAD
jgi:hypothetical protein